MSCRYMSERVVSAVANNPKLAPCFNVPFQSGDDDVLKNMRRGYTRARFLEIVAAIRKQLPDAAITADCIVGFPGETEEQFLKTLSLMEEVIQHNKAALTPFIASNQMTCRLLTHYNWHRLTY